MSKVIAVKGAREHNLKNINVDIPREQLIVITGLSGSGKSSLAFDTIYAEGQRRFLESISAFARRRIEQVKKPDVDSVYGLSPVVSIEQKTTGRNPRSTIGTMTDIYDYLRMLFATTGTAHCPVCRRAVPTRSAYQLSEHILSLPPNSVVELDAPLAKFYGEDYGYLLADVRSKGCRRIRVDGELHDISEEVELDEDRSYELSAVVDRFVIRPGIDKNLLHAVERTLSVGEGFMQLRVLETSLSAERLETFYNDWGCPEHTTIMGEQHPNYFTFNDLSGACPTCLGLGTYMQVHPDLLVPDKTRSIKEGAFVSEAWKYDKDSWSGRITWSLAQHYNFSIETPWNELPPQAVDVLLYGTRGERFVMQLPEGATKDNSNVGRLFRFDGVIPLVERRYRHYRKQQMQQTDLEDYLKRMMVEHVCPDCKGTKLKGQRMLVLLGGKTIHELGEIPIDELRAWFGQLAPPSRQPKVYQQVLPEITGRLDLLLGIGLDYLSLSRRATTLSGGEAQRVRLSTQIGSGLMGMLYVLDEPSIGLHPRDTVKLINTLQRLRDIGNTVIVVEHDEETTRAADHIIEIGPGPGVHGGKVVAQGSIDDILRHPDSLTGSYLSGRSAIALPNERRVPSERVLTVRGAREHNLKNLDVTIPLGLIVCITGASGSGKSTLINDILYKRLYALFHDSRVLAGAHDALEGVDQISDVIDIDQSPIGRSSRSNPATYIGCYDAIRQLFAEQPEAQERGFGPSRFSFNTKGGRCEECGGEGIVTTELHFMPDVQVVCPACQGTRFNEETLEITYRGKTIADVLALTVEEAVAFFADQSYIVHKLGMLVQLGLGYLTLGHQATALSGGEAQRVKLAKELSKLKRGSRNLYILDEPTTGLHLADIARLLDSLNRLADAGNTVLLIEHHLDVIKTADWVIDLGPEGGHSGGQLIASGPPEAIAACEQSYTGRYLRPYLEKTKDEKTKDESYSDFRPSSKHYCAFLHLWSDPGNIAHDTI